MKKLLTAILVAFCSQASAVEALPLEACQVQAVYGFPTFKKQHIVPICRNGYLTYFDTQAGIASMVAYVLKPENAVGCTPRDSFRPDPVVGNRPTPRVYSRSGYDTGHYANAVDLAYNEIVAYEAGYLTNMAPMLPAFNRGVWKKAEIATRAWALARGNDIQIYVAAVYNRKRDEMIREEVTIPSGFVRVLIDTDTEEVLILSFKHEGAKSARLDTFITSLAEIQRLTGIEFPMPPEPEFTGLWTTRKSTRRLNCNLD